jgi:DNA-binding XRE family transcriptional regulator
VASGTLKGRNKRPDARTFYALNGDKLVRLRRDVGYNTREDFARASGVSYWTVVALELGYRRCRPKTLAAIARAVSVAKEDLLVENTRSAWGAKRYRAELARRSEGFRKSR